MQYRYVCGHSSQVSDESDFSMECSICTVFKKGFVVWMRKQHYARETTYLGKSLRVISTIAGRSSHPLAISYQQSILWSKSDKECLKSYKNWEQIKQQIKEAVFSNLNQFQHYDKYHPQPQFKTMVNYKKLKKLLIQSKLYAKHSNLPKFTLTKYTESQQNLLLDSTLKRNYEFYPLQAFPHQKSKLQTSLQQISKLKKNLSLMITDIKLNDSLYPTTQNLLQPFIQFVKPKHQLKFRHLLQRQFSQIYQSHKTKPKQQLPQRLYTTPDPQQDPQIQNKYAQAYGFILHQNPQLKKPKKKSLLQVQLSKQKNNLSKNKILLNPKSTRQLTQHYSNLVTKDTGNSTTMTSKKSLSKGKIKTNHSKNKLLTNPSLNRLKVQSPTLNREKSLNRSKKILSQYK